MAGEKCLSTFFVTFLIFLSHKNILLKLRRRHWAPDTNRVTLIREKCVATFLLLSNVLIRSLISILKLIQGAFWTPMIYKFERNYRACLPSRGKNLEESHTRRKTNSRNPLLKRCVFLPLFTLRAGVMQGRIGTAYPFCPEWKNLPGRNCVSERAQIKTYDGKKQEFTTSILNLSKQRSRKFWARMKTLRHSYIGSVKL